METFSSGDMCDWLLNEMNSLTGSVAVTAKIGMSNLQGGSQCGAVYYWTGGGSAPPIPLEQDVWMESIDDGDDRFQDSLTQLDALTTAQAAGAHFVMDDASGSAARTGVTWPSFASNTDVIPAPPGGTPGWFSQEKTGSQLTDFLPALKTWINNTLSYHQVSMKIGASNQSGGADRSVVFYRDPWNTSAQLPTSASSWQKMEFTTGSDYAALYTAVETQLDVIESDDPRKAAVAKVAYSNRASGLARICLLWPDTVS